MDVILLERVERLGNVGDEVTVRPGYGRNFLLPHGKAIISDAANRTVFERRRSTLEANQHNEFEKATAEAEKMSTLDYSVVRSTSDGEHLYGSVSTGDLATLMTEAGFSVQRRQILLDDQIRQVGEHAFRVRLHPDVTADLKVKVADESV
ncbi:MAG: 50S ribosomal protein L9 [Mariprofundaceae bacterium]